MGFFSSLTGWDKTMAALNAVMGSYVMENADLSTKIAIADEIAKIISIARHGKPNKATILTELNQESRVVQMNFVALACDNLHIPPPFTNSYWERIKNPYAAGKQVDELLIQAAIQTEQKNQSSRITWPGISASFDFSALYESTSITKDAIKTNLKDQQRDWAKKIDTLASLDANIDLTEIAGLTASILEYVIDHNGLETLVAGSLVLYKNYKPSFHSGTPKKDRNTLAVVPLQSFEEIKIFELMLSTGILDQRLLSPLVDKLAYAVLTEFESQCIDIHKTPNSNGDSIITDEDKEAFGPDLLDLIDRVFNETFLKLSTENESNIPGQISQDDVDAFGSDLIGCIAFYTAHALINLRSNEKTLPDAMLKSASEALSDSFGPDLLDLITRYCAYKSASLEY